MNQGICEWSEAAREDVIQILAYLEDHSLAATDRFERLLATDLEILADNAEAGAQRPVFDDEFPGLRMAPIRGLASYLIFCQPTPRGILVLRIRHSARDVNSLMNLEPG